MLPLYQPKNAQIHDMWVNLACTPQDGHHVKDASASSQFTKIQNLRDATEAMLDAINVAAAEANTRLERIEIALGRVQHAFGNLAMPQAATTDEAG